MSEKKIKPPARSNNSLNPGLDYIYNVKIWVKFDGSCLKQEKITLNDKTLLNFYIIKYMAFECSQWFCIKELVTASPWVD